MKILKTNLIITLFILIASISIKAQNNFIEISTSKPYNVINAWYKFYLTNNDEVLTVKQEHKKIIFQKFNTSNLELLETNESDDLPKGFEIETLLHIKDKYFLIVSVFNKKEKTKKMYLREFSFKKANFITEQNLFLDIKDISEYSGSFYVSKDSSKILLKFRKIPEEKRDKQSFDIINFYVFDNNFNKLWSKDIKMPYTEKKMDNISYKINNDGDIYILTRIFNDDSRKIRNKKTNKINYHLELLKYEFNTAKLTQTKIETDNKNVSSISMNIKDNNIIEIAGYYKNKKGIVNGIIKYEIKNNKIDIKTFEIPLNILVQYQSKSQKSKLEKKAKKGQAGFKNLSLNEVKFTESGIILIGEQFYSKERKVYEKNGRYSYSVYTYYYNDIFVTKIGNTNKIQWMVRLPKRQMGRDNTDQLSYKYLTLNNKHYFFYIDNIKNLSLTINDIPKKHINKTGGFLTAYAVDDKTGQVEKKSLINLRDFKGMVLNQFMVSRLFKLNEEEVLLELYKKNKEDILIKIKLEEN